MNDTTHTRRIAELNDLCRQRVMVPVFGEQIPPCEILMTRGIASLSPEAQIIIAAKVRDFDDFTPDNDPHGERDFGDPGAQDG